MLYNCITLIQVIQIYNRWRQLVFRVYGEPPAYIDGEGAGVAYASVTLSSRAALRVSASLVANDKSLLLIKSWTASDHGCIRCSILSKVALIDTLISSS
jgi:hypothetical protein